MSAIQLQIDIERIEPCLFQPYDNGNSQTDFLFVYLFIYREGAGFVGAKTFQFSHSIYTQLVSKTNFLWFNSLTEWPIEITLPLSMKSNRKH